MAKLQLLHESNILPSIFSILISEQLDIVGEKSKNEGHWFQLKFIITSLKRCVAVTSLPPKSPAFPVSKVTILYSKHSLFYLSLGVSPPPAPRPPVLHSGKKVTKHELTSFHYFYFPKVKTANLAACYSSSTSLLFQSTECLSSNPGLLCPISSQPLTDFDTNSFPSCISMFHFLPYYSHQNINKGKNIPIFFN